MTNDEIYKIASEIGILGTRGIDYADPTKNYILKSIPDKEFTGLQLLCLMYVGFQKIEPTMDTGLDFKEAFNQALIAYNLGHH